MSVAVQKVKNVQRFFMIFSCGYNSAKITFMEFEIQDTFTEMQNGALQGTATSERSTTDCRSPGSAGWVVACRRELVDINVQPICEGRQFTITVRTHSLKPEQQ
jgi:hypothetical protein